MPVRPAALQHAGKQAHTRLRWPRSSRPYADPPRSSMAGRRAFISRGSRCAETYSMEQLGGRTTTRTAAGLLCSRAARGVYQRPPTRGSAEGRQNPVEHMPSRVDRLRGEATKKCTAACNGEER